MNPYQAIEAARPDVPPMPPIARRHLREHLFDIATRSHAPLGDPKVNAPNTARANAARLAALALLGLVGVGGLAYSASRGTGADDAVPISETTAPSTVGTTAAPITVLQPPPPTAAPTTTEAPVPGSAETPLLLPEGRRPLDELTVVRGALGGSSLLLQAPDLSTIALQERDGVAPPPPAPPETDATGETVPTTPPRVVGALEVSQPSADGAYAVTLPCGDLEIRDRPDAEPFRPELLQLLGAMSLTDGTINVALPDGWGVIGAGPSTDEFTFGLPVEIGGSDVTVRLAQYPGGNLAVAGFEAGQYVQTTFLDEPAWIGRDSDFADDVEVIGMFGTTAFRIGARDVELADLEAVMESLVPGDVDKWIERFGEIPPATDPDIRLCAQQPEFAVTSP